MEQQSTNMRSITFMYAVALIALGIIGFTMTGATHVTALIPAFFGVVFFLCAILASNPKLKMHVMHVAVLLALGAVVATAGALPQLPALISGAEFERPAAIVSKSVMALLSLAYVLLCIKSFIDARRKPAV